MTPSASLLCLLALDAGAASERQEVAACAGYRDAAMQTRAAAIALANATHTQPDLTAAEGTERIYRDCVAAVRKAAADAEERRRAADIAIKANAEDRDRAAAAAAASVSDKNSQQDEAEEVHDRRARDPDWMRPTVSALVCYDAWLYQRSLAEIKAEETYAKRGGGMVDKGKIYELQLHMRHANESRDGAFGQLREMKIKQLPCSSKAVKTITLCMQDEACEGDAKERIEYVDVPEGPTWSCRGFNCD